jgi:hypothetical protein
MNPISHHQLAQSKHNEYETRYGNQYVNNENWQEIVNPLSRHKLALALSGLSAIIVMVVAIL